MFRLSKAAEYTIRGILYLSLKSDGETTDIEEISMAQDVPSSYLSKLFQTLGRKGFVRSQRGPDGGFVLAKKTKDISLLEVIETIEGPIYLNDCLIRDGYCPKDDVCPVHDVWKEAQKRLLNYLSEYTFEDLAKAAKIKGKMVKEKLMA